MTRNHSTAHNDLWELAARWLPVFSRDEQRAGIVLLHELAKGEAVTLAYLAQPLGTSLAAAQALVRDSALRSVIHTDDADRIIGFWGLSVVPTHHRLSVNGRSLWTWCAQDSLFMPELLGEAAEIESRDPQSNELIRLTVAPEHIESVDPAGTVVSIGRPDTWDQSSATGLIASACHYIFFFTSRASGERWQEQHGEPETVLLSLEDAAAFGKRSNAQLFGAELARQRGMA